MVCPVTKETSNPNISELDTPEFCPLIDEIIESMKKNPTVFQQFQNDFDSSWDKVTEYGTISQSEQR